MKKRSIKSYFGSGSLDESDDKKIPASGTVECPFCDKSYSANLIDAHVSLHLIENGEGVSKRNRISEQNELSVGNSKLTSQKPEAKSSSGPNIFTQMMSERPKKRSLYFEIDWRNGKLSPRILQQPSIAPKEVQWKSTVKLKQFDPTLSDIQLRTEPCNLIISTNIAQAEESENLSSKSSTDTNINSSLHSLYKSMIQKAYRRGQVLKGTALSLRLLCEDSNEFLRRLPIILLEDGLLHICFPVAVWLMVAVSKGYSAPNWLLMISIQMYMDSSACPHKDVVCNIGDKASDAWLDTLVSTSPHSCSGNVASEGDSGDGDGSDTKERESSSRERKQPIHIKNFWELIDHPQESGGKSILGAHLAIVGSILIRAAYGGMKGDMSLLRTNAIQWHWRLSHHSEGMSGIPSDMESDSFGDGAVYPYLSTDYYVVLSPLLLLPSLAAAGSRNNDEVDQCKMMLSNYIIASANKCESDMSAACSLHTNEDASMLSTLLSRLQLRPEHLVAEGIDFHCDSRMIPFICGRDSGQNRLHQWLHESKLINKRQLSEDKEKEQITNYIKEAIWAFRSSINYRRLWPLVSDQERSFHEADVLERLETKRQLAGLWKIICPYINEYCHKRLLDIGRML